MRACRDHGVDHLVLGGGVAANSRLRALAEERCAAAGIVLRVPSPRLCTDNGAMVAALGSRLVAAGVAPSAPDLRRRQLAADRGRQPLTVPQWTCRRRRETSPPEDGGRSGHPGDHDDRGAACRGPLSCLARASGSIGEPRFLTTTRPMPRVRSSALSFLRLNGSTSVDPVAS